jgi:leader peptidase (prepilin peptidase)/N-methyltransferase
MPDTDTLHILYLLAFVMGAAFGSFVTLVSYRLPLGEDIIVKPSRCPKCETKLGVKDLFPILSWLVSRGKCRHCKAPVHFRYPLTDLLLALTFLGITMLYGASIQTLLLCALATELAIMIVTDFEHTIIPDSIQIALALTGILYLIYHDTDWTIPALSVAVCGGLGLALHFGYPYFRGKDGLGFGDVKFLAVTGFWIPLSDFPAFLFIAGFSGTILGLLWRWKKGGEIFPFGPALALSLYINVLMPNLLGRLA